MHEMSIAENIFGIIEDAKCAHNFYKVKEIHLEIGALASIEVESLRFCLEVVLKNTVAADAQIKFELIPSIGNCWQCGATIAITSYYDACIKCGNYGVRIVSGNEMKITELLVE